MASWDGRAAGRDEARDEAAGSWAWRLAGGRRRRRLVVWLWPSESEVVNVIVMKS